MSATFKKAQKAARRSHKERHQPAARQRLGLLEKHKDYVLRARYAYVLSLMAMAGFSVILFSHSFENRTT